jgi:2-amino-4-hydroxy-6-hydroxymethyldihydropteridine diphosphokinase
MHKAYIGIGTNIEPRLERMLEALGALEEFGSIEKQSSVYETAPFGFTEQSNFLNAVVILQTPFELPQLHDALQRMEKELGRVERQRWHEREIDYDILFFDNVIMNSEKLTVPHPELQKRSFVLVPLAEIAPDLLHPVLKMGISELLNDLEYESESIHSL